MVDTNTTLHKGPEMIELALTDQRIVGHFYGVPSAYSFVSDQWEDIGDPVRIKPDFLEFCQIG